MKEGRERKLQRVLDSSKEMIFTEVDDDDDGDDADGVERDKEEGEPEECKENESVGGRGDARGFREADSPSILPTKNCNRDSSKDQDRSCYCVGSIQPDEVGNRERSGDVGCRRVGSSVWIDEGSVREEGSRSQWRKGRGC